VQSIFSNSKSIWGGIFINIISSKLNVTTINGVIKYLLNLPKQTNTILIYEKFNVNNFKIIFNEAVLVDLYKHLIPGSDHELNTRYMQNVSILIPTEVSKSF